MKKLFIMLPLLMLGFSSCGPSKSEVEARLKAVQDSMAQVTTKLQAVQDSIATAADQAKQEELKQQLIDLKAQLAAEQYKLDDTEQFKLLRSKDEKAQQIEAQTKVVEQLKSDIEDIQKQIKQ